jgi:putative transposase
MSSGSSSSRSCRPRRGVGDAPGRRTGEPWKASPGGTARGRHGVTYRWSSDPGRPFGNGISAGHRTARTRGSSTRPARPGCYGRAPGPSWNSCCRSIRPWSEPINTPQAPANHRSGHPMRQTQPTPQGACSNYTILPAEPADHALGRSRGGLSTKIHTLTDDRTRPVTVILTAGQDGDNPQLVPLLDLHRRQFPPDRTPQFRLLADKAYSHPSTRQMLRRRRIKHTIPERQDQRDRRSAKGAKGGRPPGFDKNTYAKRNTVERGYLRLKQWRGIATRYDKHALTFLGGVTLAITLIHLRTN